MDETTARSEIQVPGVGSRDGVDYRLEDRDGVLWIDAKGSLYMDAAGAPDLFTGSGWAYSTIQDDGYARWYQVGGAAGKAMTVQVPEDAGFWVYRRGRPSGRLLRGVGRHLRHPCRRAGRSCSPATPAPGSICGSSNRMTKRAPGRKVGGAFLSLSLTGRSGTRSPAGCRACRQR